MEEKEEQRNGEKLRRKTGQELTQIKEKLEEAEMKKALEAKKKEKEEEKKAKARIMAEIELDKKNRAAKVFFIFLFWEGSRTRGCGVER